MSATHVDPETLGRAFQIMDNWGHNPWYVKERDAWWIIRTEYKIMRKELQRCRYDYRQATNMWMELATKPKPRCRRRLQPVVRFLINI